MGTTTIGRIPGQRLMDAPTKPQSFLRTQLNKIEIWYHDKLIWADNFALDHQQSILNSSMNNVRGSQDAIKAISELHEDIRCRQDRIELLRKGAGFEKSRAQDETAMSRDLYDIINES